LLIIDTLRRAPQRRATLLIVIALRRATLLIVKGFRV
jgi:hypothetical protein